MTEVEIIMTNTLLISQNKLILMIESEFDTFVSLILICIVRVSINSMPTFLLKTGKKKRREKTPPPSSARKNKSATNETKTNIPTRFYV